MEANYKKQYFTSDAKQNLVYQEFLQRNNKNSIHANQ